MTRPNSKRLAPALLLGAALAVVGAAAQAQNRPVGCGLDGTLPLVQDGSDIIIKKGVSDEPCKVVANPDGQPYRVGNVNIIDGGTLQFTDAKIDFWAANILVENTGSLIAGVDAPIGTHGGSLTIHLYGKDQGPGTGHGDGGVGIACMEGNHDGLCGVPPDIWNSNIDPVTKQPVPPASAVKISTLPSGPLYPGVKDDYFYAYRPLPYDDGKAGEFPVGYFGYKVLGVSYGGTLQLFGKKGSSYTPAVDADSSNSGTSWVRLDGTIEKTATTLKVDRPVDWQIGDQIVVTTTDYLPGHSEVLEITKFDPDGTITFVNVEPTCPDAGGGVCWRHYGQRTLLNLPEKHPPERPQSVGPDEPLRSLGAETRAAVALLTRSIRIVSEGDTYNDLFPPATTKYDVPNANPPRQEGYYFGGHTIVRQGFKTFQIQGVEFKQMGQGGRIGHYPVHFHMARKPAADTFVKDSSINESMTRWVVLHSTGGDSVNPGVTLARNVGFKSIGHGYYLEDGTETDNRLLSNIGIFARAAVDNAQNPRKVPGILAAQIEPNPFGSDNVPFYTDFDHPTVFWIMNGWNDFEYNMAVGAGTCGLDYWLVPGANSGPSRKMRWESYASLQADPTGQHPLDRASLSPLKRFVGNYASSAMMSFNTVGDTAPCSGVGNGIGREEGPRVEPVANPLAPRSCNQSNATLGPLAPYACNKPEYAAADDYYPKVDAGGTGRHATRCSGTDCSTVRGCDSAAPDNCMVTVLDHYTSSFHWAQTNFAAIWLRNQWYLVENSVLTDVQNGGLSFITGGGYTNSDIIPGHWALVRNSVFIGNTQVPAENPYASNAGPFNPQGLSCDPPYSGNHCLSAAEGISFLLSNFAVNQRMLNIYDGPTYQDSNAYLDIKEVTLTGCTDRGTCNSSRWPVGRVAGVPKRDICYMPNAAIGWKQPNGFYYPPAFHSTNLFFRNVDIRHFVIEPLTVPGTYKTDPGLVDKRYCTWTDNMFNNFTDIDRQTELNDDDGSLTGYVNTISVNLDSFFNAPLETEECASDITAKTSPYDYVTSVVYPGCGDNCPNVCVPPLAPGAPAACKDTNGGTVTPGMECRDGADCLAAWSKPCENQQCYGIPLYRQTLTECDLNPADPRCPQFDQPGPPEGPFVRMAGQSTGQRSTLTANNATYYIDTRVDASDQRAAVKTWTAGDAFLSAFQKGKPYYVFTIFAKPTTRQTYELYVGPGFDKDSTAQLWATRADIAEQTVKFTPPNTVAWPSTWVKSYDPGTGVLTVTMDMNNFDEFSNQYEGARPGKCQPASFCKWNDGANGSPGVCAGADDAPADAAAACKWAGNDIDCPKGGCYGFGVTLTSTFATDPVVPSQPRSRPKAMCAPNDAAWKGPFVVAPGGIAGICPIAKLPDPPPFCTDAPN